MNVRLVASSVLVLLLSHSVSGQQMPRGVDDTGAPAGVTADGSNVSKQKLMHRIAVQEEAVRQAESAHATNVQLGRTYERLGLSYQDAAEWNRAEPVLEHAVLLLRRTAGADADLATAISQLATLHVLMRKLREGEREGQEALKIRQDLGDQLQIARSRNDLAILYMAKEKYAKARDLARQAEAEFMTNERANPLDRITARFTLAEALCALKECPSVIPTLKEALDEAKVALHPDDFPLGLSTFLLGYAYWKSGRMSEAEDYLKQGTAQMNIQLGWGHPSYLKALRCYAQFLHENQQVEAANVVERRIRQAEAVVDVHSMQTAQGMFGLH
ncbi:MAG TPA: tetratricopeptide repeat protein [Edaphobacter sp.]|nr:tetratricopeptide repeat protein [Edaphobacter sp.]